MFPSDNQGHESFFDDLASISFPPNTTLEDQFMGENSGLVINTMGEMEQRLPPIIEENNNDDLTKEKMKKVHKEIERKRRKEMASLHSSLRSLLPVEYIRGKRSISDHIHESVNYIKDKENNIKELSIKRDKLKTMSNSNVVSTANASSINNMLNRVTISPCCDGFEILITCVLDGEVFPLSRVLQIMLEESLDVVSYVSTQTNERLFITIKTQSDNSRSVDLSLLEQKLADLIN